VIIVQKRIDGDGVRVRAARFLRVLLGIMRLLRAVLFAPGFAAEGDPIRVAFGLVRMVDRVMQVVVNRGNGEAIT